MKRTGIGSVALGLLLSAPVMVAAQDSSWTCRARGLWDKPSGAGGTIVGTGGTAYEPESALAPEVGVTLKVHRNLGVELGIATWRNDTTTSGGAIGALEAGSARILPVNVILQYHVTTGDSPLKPYLGVGLNYTKMWDYAASPQFAALGIADVTASSSFNLAAQAGVDVVAKKHWLVNADLKYVRVRTDLTPTTAIGTSMPSFNVVIDPWVVGFGVGYRF
jgi:outer membrane protein